MLLCFISLDKVVIILQYMYNENYFADDHFLIYVIIVCVITGDALSYKQQSLIILCHRYALRMRPVAMCVRQRWRKSVLQSSELVRMLELCAQRRVALRHRARGALHVSLRTRSLQDGHFLTLLPRKHVLLLDVVQTIQFVDF